MKLDRILMALATAGVSLALSDPETRGIVPEEVVQARPQPKAAGANAARPKYQPMGAFRQPSAARQIGVTIWRLRPAAPGDSGARILVQEETKTVEWVPERISASSSLTAGDRVRLTVEAPEAGYLYVIDRERYASGERGAPYLIFPTSRTRNGDNRVTGGKLIDIPAQDDRPNFFSLRRSRPDQSEEELTMLLTTEPIQDLEIGPTALKLTNEQVAKWEKQWGAARIEHFELSGGRGKTWTQAEQEAAANTTRLLTQEDPPPQTVYRVAVKPGVPFIVKVHLRYK
jgi:Domain of unknown function (DUF4384)